MLSNILWSFVKNLEFGKSLHRLTIGKSRNWKVLSCRAKASAQSHRYHNEGQGMKKGYNAVGACPCIFLALLQ